MRVGALSLKLRMTCGDTYAFGPGRADLLEAIAAHGSISAAGRALAMSYRRAWLLVDETNRCFCSALVETSRGGGHDRGARLTDLGRTVLAAYREMEAAAAKAAGDSAYATISAALREHPLPPD